MRVYPTPARDFIEAVLIGATDECVLWPFAVRKSSGYAAWQRPRGEGPRSIDAHRYICERTHGSAPTPDHEASHRCGKKTCVNPRHIYWADHFENMDDAKRHGTLRGGGRYRQRISQHDRAMIQGSKESLVTIAKRYNMEPSYIGRIRRSARQFDL